MSTPPRRLIFSVGASLLTASLAVSVAGCDKQPVDTKPEAEPEAKPVPNLEDPFKNQREVAINSGPEPELVPNSGPLLEPLPLPEQRTHAGREAEPTSDPGSESDPSREMAPPKPSTNVGREHPVPQPTANPGPQPPAKPAQ